MWVVSEAAGARRHALFVEAPDVGKVGRRFVRRLASYVQEENRLLT